ncbi:MAG: MFS transporter [Candidatus Thermoplasmatota archaeon]
MMQPPISSPASRWRLISAIPTRVRRLIVLTSPISLSTGYMFVFVTAYLPQIGIGSAAIGLMLGANGFAMILSAIPLGLLSDRWGRKWILLAAAVAVPPSLLVFALTTNVVYLVLANVVMGVADGAFLATWNAIIADQTTTEQRDAAFSLSFILGNVTMGVGFALPLAFPLVQAWTGLDSSTVHTEAMTLAAALAVLTPLFAWLLLRDYVEVRHARAKRARGMRWGPLLTFSGLNGLIGLGAGFIIPLIPLWFFLKFGVPDTFSGPLLAVSNITIGLAAVVSAALSRRYGPVRAIVMAEGMATGFMLSLAFAGNPVLAGGLYLVRAALMNMSSPLADSFLMGIIEPEQRGFASAINSIVWRLPNSVTTILGGILFAAGNYDLPIYLATLFYAVAVTGFYVAFRNVKPGT